jgi:hypothetical protein
MWADDAIVAEESEAHRLGGYMRSAPMGNPCGRTDGESMRGAQLCAPLNQSSWCAAHTIPDISGRPVPFGDDHDAPPPITATPKPIVARPSASPRSGKARPCHKITAADGCAISPCVSATIVCRYPTETARRHQSIHVPRAYRRHAVTWGWGESRAHRWGYMGCAPDGDT